MPAFIVFFLLEFDFYVESFIVDTRAIVLIPGKQPEHNFLYVA